MCVLGHVQARSEMEWTEKMQAGFYGEPAQIKNVGLIFELHQQWHLERQRWDKDRTIKAMLC